MGERLAGKVAVITGAGTGIGAATAERFAAEGARVILCGRRQKPLTETAARIESAGGIAQASTVDVSDEEQFAGILQKVFESEGRMDILVNNAFSYAGGMIADTSTEDWRTCFRTSLDGAFFGVRAVIPGMQAQGGGSIVNISSVMGLLGAAGSAGYGAAKAALIQFTRIAALEGARGGVRVNVVVPGVVMTPSTQAALPNKAAERATAQSVPLGRIAESSEVANAILFLASGESSYITGATLVVDGGKTCELNTGASDMADFASD